MYFLAEVCIKIDEFHAQSKITNTWSLGFTRQHPKQLQTHRTPVHNRADAHLDPTTKPTQVVAHRDELSIIVKETKDIYERNGDREDLLTNNETAVN